MKKIEGQMAFEFNPEEEKDETRDKVGERELDEKEKQKKKEKRVEDRIKVESVERVEDELTGELCYRIVLFWEVIQQSIGFLYYPKDDKVRWTFKPNVYISEEWWEDLINRAKAVGRDHYKRDQKKLKESEERKE